MFQAGKMPDANDGDVAVFPFTKRTIGDLGKAITAEDLQVSVKRAWKQVTPAVCKKIRARVLRSMAIVNVDGIYDENYARPVDLFFCLKEIASTGFLCAPKATA
jgi:hypothetical protein